MDNSITYSSQDAYNKAMAEKGVILPTEQNLADPNVPLSEAETERTELTDEQKGEMVARLIQMGIVPTFEEAKYYRKWQGTKKVDAWNAVGDAFAHTVSTLAEGAYELGKDIVTLQPQKVIGSAVEGAALGTKNWLYMYEQAKYDESSWLHKMMFDTHANDQDYYWNLKQSIETNKMIKRDAEEGILIPNKVNIGGFDLDLTNPAVVQAVSYVADPSWLMPNLGIESTLAKGFAGASRVLQLNEQLTKAGLFATNKLAGASEALASRANKTASLIERTEARLEGAFHEMTGVKAELTTGGKPLYRDTLVRGAVDPIGGNNVRLPAWGLTQAVWGVAKVVETAGSTAEMAFKLAGKQAEIQGMRLSERIAMESKNKTVQNLATTWSKTASPFIEYATNATKTSLHSAMYGGAFGVVFGGEEGFYNGLGTGFALGGAFHHIGLAHGAVSGAKAIPDTIKNFLWSTSHMDFFNQEAISHFLKQAETEGGVTAKLRAMSDIAGIERLARTERRIYLREDRIREMHKNQPEAWGNYEQLLANPDWGGVAFHKTETGENITIVNVDRASKSAFREEFFHTAMLGRYAEAFKKAGVDALIGTEDKQGALYRMPKEESVRLLKAFKDSYLKLEKSTSGSLPENVQKLSDDFDLAIEQVKRGERPEVLRTAYEEFLASYWNRFIEEKPLDYLLNGGDLGMVRNTVEWAKSVYRDVMYQDLTSAGANFKWGENPDNFFIEQNTKQRIRIPELERLMKHYVKEVGKDRYRGWERNKPIHNTAGMALASGLGHLFTSEGGTAKFRDVNEINEEHSKGTLSAIDEIATTLSKEDRGLTFSFIGGREGSNVDFSFSPAKKKKKKAKEETEELPKRREEQAFYEEQRRKMEKNGQARKAEKEAGSPIRSDLNATEVKETARLAGDDSEIGDNAGWSMYKSADGFWKSEWNGNARLKISGKATNKELAILEKYLPKRVVQTFADINNVIESSRFISKSTVSNVLRGEVLTQSRELPSGKREKLDKGEYFINDRKFVPVEVNMYFERQKGKVVDGYQTWKVGKARLLLTSIDMDALVKRVDYSWSELKDRSGIDYSRVRKLFGSKQNLMEAVKRLLENYSKGQKAEAGAEMFRGEEGSIREAQDKRDIVNAVIGYHPTKMMLEGGSKFIEKAGGHYPLKMQLRQEGKKTVLPTVMTNFRIDRIGDLRSYPLEGFRYNHDNAYVRAQFNYSPSKTSRDHEGNLVSAGLHSTLGNSVYRNREGEVITVYNLDKPNSIIRKNKETDVYTYVDDSLSAKFDKVNPFLRGKANETLSGWHHFTPDGYEAGFNTGTRLSTGWIDTQRHIDLSQIDAGSTVKEVVDLLSERMSKVTGENKEVIKQKLLAVRIGENRLFELYTAETRKPWDSHNFPIESWLFNKETIPFFRKYDIHSVEYNSMNAVNGHQYSSIALFEGQRFIENRSRKNDAQKFSFSPSKPLAEQLEKKIREVGVDKAFLDYVLNEDGEYVPNTKKITETDVDRIIQEEQQKLESARARAIKADTFSTQNRERHIATLTPYVYASLRKEFPFAPKKVLEQITQLSLQGYQLDRIGLQGKGRNAPLVVKESLFIKEAKKYGITGERIRKTGIPSLGHWAEMTEKEYAMFKKHQEFEEYYKKNTSEAERALGEFASSNSIASEWLSRPENKEYADGILKHNGWSGFMDELGSRGRDLLFMVDSEITKRRATDSQAPFPLVLKTKEMKDFFARKTQAYLTQTLQSGKMNLKQRKALLEIKNGYEDILSARMLEAKGDEFSPFYENTRQVRELYESYQSAIEDIISQEAKNRIDDMLTAYHIQEADPEMIGAVRTALYQLANDGQIRLGTPEAVQKAVELYAGLNNANRKKVIDIQTAINKNYVKALISMEEKGYHGTMWQLQTRKGHKFDNGREISGDKLWKWDGSGYYVVEKGAYEGATNVPSSAKRGQDLLFGRQAESISKYEASLYNKNVLELYDKDGNLVYSDIYELTKRDESGELLDRTKEEIDAKRTEFLRLASKKLDDNTYAQSIFSGHYTVEGSSKEFILRSLLQDARRSYPDVHAQLTGEVKTEDRARRTDEGEIAGASKETNAYLNISDWSNWELYNNKGTYLAIRRNDRQAVSTELKVNKKFIRRGNRNTVETRMELADKTTVAEQITNIEDYLKQNTTIDNGKQRWLNLDEKIALREKLAELKRVQYEDKGLLFEFDSKLAIVIPEEGRNINTIEKRIKALDALATGRYENVGFFEQIKELYSQFDRELKSRVEPRIRKRIEEVISNGPTGNIAKLKTLVSELRSLRQEYNNWLKERYDEELQSAKENKRKPKSVIELLQSLKRDKATAEQAVRDAQQRKTIIQQRLIEMGQLDGWERLSKEEQDDHYIQYAMYENRGVVDKWMGGLRQNNKQNSIQYLKFLKEELASMEQRIAQKRFQVEAYDENTTLNKEKADDVKAKMLFLIDQYARAKGLKFTPEQLDKFLESSLGTEPIVDKFGDTVEGVKQVVFNYTNLKSIGLKKNSAPHYLADKDGVVTKHGIPEKTETVEQYVEAFKEGIMQIRDRYVNASNKDDLGYRFVMSEGRDYRDSTPSLESPYSGRLKSVLTKNNFSKKDLVWINSPENFKEVQAVEAEWKSNLLSDDEFVQAIKEKVMLTELGPDGVNLLSSEARLNRVNSEIAMRISELRSLTHISRAFNGTDIISIGDTSLMVPKTYERVELTQRHMALVEQWRALAKRKQALEARIEKIIASADSPDANPEFARIISERKARKDIADRVRENMKQREAEILQWKQQFALDAETLFSKYDKRAQSLGYSSSRIPIKASEVYSQSVMLGFPTLTHDFFPHTPELNWSITQNDIIGINSGWAEKGELHFVPRGPTDKNVIGAESEKGYHRTIYLADYISRIEQWANFHLDPKNERVPLTPEQALGLEKFFPELNDHPILIEKKKLISSRQVEEVINTISGIRDRFPSSNDRERFIRTFVTDALEVIKGNTPMREEAYKRLTGTTDEQFERLRSTMDAKDFDKMLNSKEIFERCMYLIAENGRLTANKDNPLNYQTDKNGNKKYIIFKEEKKVVTRGEPLKKGVKGKPISQTKVVSESKSTIPFLTTEGFGIPIDTLIRMDGFDRIWDTEVISKQQSVFEGSPYTKIAYEQIPLEARIQRPDTAINKIMAENEAGMIERQRLEAQRRGAENKPMWGNDYGAWIDKETTRVQSYIDTVGMVEGSVARMKGQVTTFINKRQKALRELLAVQDGLSFTNLDWSNPDLGSWRESNDGRYIIKKDGTAFKIYFVGESVFNKSGTKVMEIPTSQIATVSDLVQAQVMVRFFNDDVSRLHHASKMIEGGSNNTPYSVEGQNIPTGEKGELVPSINYIPDFAKWIIELYEANRGTPAFQEEMINSFQEIGQYGEQQFIRVNGDGVPVLGQIVITPNDFNTVTPLQEATLAKTHNKGYDANGDVVWTPKPSEEANPTGVPVEETKPAGEKDVSGKDNPEPTQADKTIADATHWDIVSNLPASTDQMFSEWSTIRNRLNYTLIKIKTQKGTNAYRLFNPASGFMGGYADERDAVDAVLKQEFKSKQ